MVSWHALQHNIDENTNLIKPLVKKSIRLSIIHIPPSNIYRWHKTMFHHSVLHQPRKQTYITQLQTDTIWTATTPFPNKACSFIKMFFSLFFAIWITSSVMGITTWVGQRQNGLLASILGIRSTTGQWGQLSVKGRLHQQPARVLSAAGPSRQR
jgi:hypothetical protein